MKIKSFIFVLILLMLTGMVAFAKSDSYFSPYDDCTKVRVSTLDTAKKTVLISCYGLTSKPIADELLILQKRGVRVRICVDKRQSEGKRDLTKSLSASGIEVTVKPSRVLEHNKFMIVDSTALITGSFNFTKSASKQDNNIVVITKDRKTIRAYHKAWMRIFHRDKDKHAKRKHTEVENINNAEKSQHRHKRI